MNKKELIIKIERLVKSYDKKKVVNSISFDVKKGEVFGILGPNGAGKTTTLEMLEGLRKPDSGNIEVAGINVVRVDLELSRK